jgi:gluconokinase
MNSVLDEVLDAAEPSPEFISVMRESNPAVLLGIDIGTSGVRAALFDDRANELPGASIHQSRELSTRSGFAELDPDAALQLVVQTIDDLLALPQVADLRLELISISCFWHSLLGIDVSGQPTTPIIGWADTRSAGITNELRNRFNERQVHDRTGCRFHPSYWPAKLLWLRDEDPQGFRRTTCWLGFAEYLVSRLFDESATSISMASATGLFNQQECDWDYDFVKEVGIAEGTLPQVISSSLLQRQLNDTFRRRWPQLSSAHLSPPIGDGAANNIGAGCHTRERAALMVGTSGALRTLYEGEAPQHLPGALWCYRADRSRVVVGGALSDGGGLYHWLTQSLVLDQSGDGSLERVLSEMEPDSHGLTVLPFWAGERSTGWNPNARGAILGLTMQTQPTDILCASMEAVAYRFASILQDLDSIAPGANIIAAGNALRLSPVWAQIIADVINRPVLLGGMHEASMRGAALLALEAAGKIQSIEEFESSVEIVFEPDAARHSIYRDGLARHQKFYDLLIAT